jgi:hypothetical protein
MACEIDPVTTDNELVYSSLSNAVIAAGESKASAAMSASSARAAATNATAAIAAKNAAFASETLASESAAIAVTKAATAYTKAEQAKIQRELAHKWASESEAVWVSDGVNVPGFSAYHWAQQAEHQNGLTRGGIAQYIADGVADYILYNAIGNSLLNTALGTRIDQIDTIDARTRADALITLQEIIDRGTAITNEQTLRLEGEEQLAQNITTLSATTVANIAAAVLVESSARASEFEAVAMVMSLLTAQFNDPITGLEKTRADILSERTVRVSNEEATAGIIDTIISTHNTDTSSAIASIQEEQTTRASENSALSESIATLQTSVGSHTTAIQVTQSVVDGINAKYAVKIDNNGYVSGYGLLSTAINGTPVSDFAIRADKFSIANPSIPGGVPVVPFVVITTPTVIDGTLYNAGTYMQAAMIVKLQASQIDTRGLTIKDGAGTVILGAGTGLNWNNVAYGNGKPADNATVGATIGTNLSGQITAANASTFIASAAIGTAFIGDAAITSAKIGDLQVDAVKIAGNSISRSFFVESVSTHVSTGSIPIFGRVHISVMFFGAEVRARDVVLYRDGIPISAVSGILGLYVLIAVDQPGAGQHTYEAVASSSINIIKLQVLDIQK